MLDVQTDGDGGDTVRVGHLTDVLPRLVPGDGPGEVQGGLSRDLELLVPPGDVRRRLGFSITEDASKLLALPHCDRRVGGDRNVLRRI